MAAARRGRRFSMTEKLGVKAGSTLPANVQKMESLGEEEGVGARPLSASSKEVSIVERVKARLAACVDLIDAAEGIDAKCAVLVASMREGLDDPLFFASVCDRLSTMTVGPDRSEMRGTIATGEGFGAMEAALTAHPDDPNVKFHWMKLVTILASDQNAALGCATVDRAVGILERSMDDAIVVSQAVKAFKNFASDVEMRAQVRSSGALDTLQAAIDGMGGNAILSWRLADLTNVVTA